MKIKVRSVACDETFLPLNCFITTLETALGSYFNAEHFDGIDELVIVVVSVDDDHEVNEKFAKKHNISGTYKHPFKQERVKFFSIAILIEPQRVVTLAASDLKAELCEAVIRELINTTVKVPKGFEFDRFSIHAKIALEILKRTEI